MHAHLPNKHLHLQAPTWNTTAISEPSLCLASPTNMPSGRDKTEAIEEPSASTVTPTYAHQNEWGISFNYIFYTIFLKLPWNIQMLLEE